MPQPAEKITNEDYVEPLSPRNKFILPVCMCFNTTLLRMVFLVINDYYRCLNTSVGIVLLFNTHAVPPRAHCLHLSYILKIIIKKSPAR